MNERRKSDSPIVPGKLPSKGRSALRFAEGVEGRGLAEGNLFQQPKFRTQSRTDLQNALRRIQQAAQKDRNTSPSDGELKAVMGILIKLILYMGIALYLSLLI